MNSNNFDVIIVGGGLAGLSLARQIKLTRNDISVVVLEKSTGQSESATHKVGESSVEVGAYYYAQTLQMEDYIEDNHYEKLGLRYFFESSTGKFSDRPEFGVDDFLPAKSYQFNRGTFENYLRGLIKEQGVELIEGAVVMDVELRGKNEMHDVIFEKDGEVFTLTANWVVDASGRRRMIQNKYGFATKASQTAHSSSWFRVKGRCNIDDVVPEANSKWHGRVKKSRWFSTNHLMGKGYWVWLIPLKGDYTSIGIVANEDYHPFSGYNTQRKALNWIAEHEPELSNLLKGYDLLDFKVIKNYSLSSTRVFSEDGWACVGEASVFADPFYSVGNNLIAYANGITTNLICNSEKINEGLVDYYNSFFISLCENLTYNIQIGMPYMNDGRIMSLKIIWDYYIGWGISDALYYHDIYLDAQKARVVSQFLSRSITAQNKVIRLLSDWSEKTSVKSNSFFLDYIKDLPTLTAIFTKNLPPKKEQFGDALQGIRYSVDKIEDFANFLFFMAIREIYPEEYEKIQVKWVDYTKITLDRSQWEELGLFNTVSQPRSWEYIEEEICSALNIPTHASA